MDENNNQVRQVSFCRKCGNRLIDGSIYCSKCGTKAVPYKPVGVQEVTFAGPLEQLLGDMELAHDVGDSAESLLQADSVLLPKRKGNRIVKKTQSILQTVKYYKCMLYIFIGCLGFLCVTGLYQMVTGKGGAGIRFGAVGWYLRIILPPAGLGLSIASIFRIKRIEKVDRFLKFALGTIFAISYFIVYLLYSISIFQLVMIFGRIDSSGTIVAIVVSMILLPLPLLATWSVGLSATFCCAIIPAFCNLLRLFDHPDLAEGILLQAAAAFFQIFVFCVESYLIGRKGGKKLVILGGVVGFVDSVLVTSILNFLSFGAKGKIDLFEWLIFSAVLHVLILRTKRKPSSCPQKVPKPEV